MRMSDVFNLPVHQNESEFFACVINMPDCNRAIGQMNSESWAKYAVLAINNYDQLTDENARLREENERIFELLDWMNSEVNRTSTLEKCEDGAGKFIHDVAVSNCIDRIKRAIRKPDYAEALLNKDTK